MTTVFGGNEGTTIPGTKLDDLIRGGGGDDVVRGGRGNDNLFGGRGEDRIVGGEGNDTLTGDHNAHFADTFVFHADSGKDVIMDFDTDEDILEITRGLGGIQKAADVLDHARQVGDNVVIKLGDGNKITLKGVDLDDLKKHPGQHFDIV